MPVAWRPAAGDAPRLRYWGGDYVAYSPLSGNTHFLDIATGEVLRAVVAAPQTSHALCARLAALLELPADGRLAAHAEQILARLEELALIEPVEAC